MKQRTADPVERVVAAALDAAGIRYQVDAETGAGLDFWLPDDGVFIEVKRFHSDRIAAQMAKAENVIAIQGMNAARAFAKWIGNSRAERELIDKVRWIIGLQAAGRVPESALAILQEQIDRVDRAKGRD